MRKLNSEQDLQELRFAATASAAFGAAIETGLLWKLAERPLGGADVAQALNIPLRRCLYWLQFLEALGIVEKDTQGYLPTALVHSSILESRSQESWRHLVTDERERSAGVHNLALYLSEPGSVWAAQGLVEPRDYVEKMRLDPIRAREFTRMLYEVHAYLGEELAELLDLSGVHRIMDLGGNSGVVSMALLRKYPGLTATVVDIENVCIAGREIAQENSLSDRISYYPAEFERDEFPTGFDMVLMCDVSVFTVAFFRKVWASLNPGGQLVIVDLFSPEENALPASRLRWSFLDSLEDPNFSILTIAQVRERLVCAGFQVLSGQRVLSDDRILFQARK